MAQEVQEPAWGGVPGSQRCPEVQDPVRPGVRAEAGTVWKQQLRRQSPALAAGLEKAAWGEKQRPCLHTAPGMGLGQQSRPELWSKQGWRLAGQLLFEGSRAEPMGRDFVALAQCKHRGTRPQLGGEHAAPPCPGGRAGASPQPS
ncbi:hypothetical protein KIL84_014176 [Mauremys mutica]|uniref:Uncharacterized protein n=1 Tax=Mauremys mutica TaxID=74926 RepID=A0A9D3XQV4_9SAUR|nr:hypothetical protein KIL84_014176 [Mauremys mutica]